MSKIFFISDKKYDKLKWICNKFPLLITCYSTIGIIWNLPFTEQIILTISAIHTCICGFLEISNKKYKSK